MEFGEDKGIGFTDECNQRVLDQLPEPPEEQGRWVFDEYWQQADAAVKVAHFKLGLECLFAQKNQLKLSC
jgi:hypothetical protein